MKNLRTPVAMAAGLLLLAACDTDYDVTVPTPDAPYQSQVDARLASYGKLGEYAGPTFTMGASISGADLAKKELDFSIVRNNFTQVEAPGAFTQRALMTDGKYNFSSLSTLSDAAAAAGVKVFGPALCSLTGIADDYLKSLVADVVVPYQPWTEERLVADFENEALGTPYPSTKSAAGKVAVSIADDPVGAGHGKVLKGDLLRLDLPKIPEITLPDGATLGDITRISFMCYNASKAGAATGSRIVVDNIGITVKTNPHNTVNEWLQYDFILTPDNFKPSADQRKLTTFSLALGAYGNNITCYVDEVKIYIDHLTGDDTVISIPLEKKKEIIRGEMDRWIEGLVEASGTAVNSFIIYDEPFADADAKFSWADYLGDNYVAEVQNKVNSLAKGNVKYYVSQTIPLGEHTVADIDDLAKAVRKLQEKGVSVDGVNIVMSGNFSESHAVQSANLAATVNAMERLAKLNMPVRISNFTVNVFDRNGSQRPASALNTVERQAVADYYAQTIAAFRKSLGSRAAGFSLGSLREGSAGVAPWSAAGDRTPVYEGIVKGLTSK